MYIQSIPTSPLSFDVTATISLLYTYLMFSLSLSLSHGLLMVMNRVWLSTLFMCIT